MKRERRTALLLAAVLLIAGTVIGTLAYMTSTDEVQNTFTVGKVKITLDEAKVNPKGQLLNDQNEVWKDGETLAGRVKENAYHLIPGLYYYKDPTVHIGADSEPAYLFVNIRVDDNTDVRTVLENHGLDAHPEAVLDGLDMTKWTIIAQKDDGDARIYTLAYKEIVNPATGDVQVFEGFRVPTDLTNEDLEAIKELKLTVTAYAVQEAGFTDATNAWNQTFGK